MSRPAQACREPALEATRASRVEAAASFFVLRAPLLPIDDLLTLSDGLRGPELGADAAASQMRDALDADRRTVAERLAELATRPEISVTLARANPSAYVVADTVRHLRSAGLNKPKLSVLALTPAPELVLRVAGRPVSRATLEDRLGALLPADRASALVTGLVDRELLVPAGWPAATGVGHVRQLAAYLHGTDVAFALRRALIALGDLETSWPAVSPDRLEAVRGTLAEPLDLTADQSGFHAELLQAANRRHARWSPPRRDAGRGRVAVEAAAAPGRNRFGSLPSGIRGPVRRSRGAARGGRRSPCGR